MRAEFHPAAIVADAHVRVMVLAMHEPGDGRHERKGLVVVLEGPALRDDLPVVRPAGYLLQERVDLRPSKGRRSGGEGSGFPCGELRHVSPPKCAGFSVARCATTPAGGGRQKTRYQGSGGTAPPSPR